LHCFTDSLPGLVWSPLPTMRILQSLRYLILSTSKDRHAKKNTTPARPGWTKRDAHTRLRNATHGTKHGTLCLVHGTVSRFS
jgi:hypothetical protein